MQGTYAKQFTALEAAVKDSSRFENGGAYFSFDAANGQRKEKATPLPKSRCFDCHHEKAATDHVPCGPDVEPVVKAVQGYVDAGYSHVYFHQIGDDQEGFFNFWSSDLQPALADLAVDRSAA